MNAAFADAKMSGAYSWTAVFMGPGLRRGDSLLIASPAPSPGSQNAYLPNNSRCAASQRSGLAAASNPFPSRVG